MSCDKSVVIFWELGLFESAAQRGWYSLSKVMAGANKRQVKSTSDQPPFPKRNTTNPVHSACLTSSAQYLLDVTTNICHNVCMHVAIVWGCPGSLEKFMSG